MLFLLLQFIGWFSLGSRVHLLTPSALPGRSFHWLRVWVFICSAVCFPKSQTAVAHCLLGASPWLPLPQPLQPVLHLSVNVITISVAQYDHPWLGPLSYSPCEMNHHVLILSPRVFQNPSTPMPFSRVDLHHLLPGLPHYRIAFTVSLAF